MQDAIIFHHRHWMYSMSSVNRYHEGMVGEVVIETLIATTSSVTLHMDPHNVCST